MFKYADLFVRYNKGRLIKSFLRVGIQLNPASPGIGVMGIVCWRGKKQSEEEKLKNRKKPVHY